MAPIRAVSVGGSRHGPAIASCRPATQSHVPSCQPGISCPLLPPLAGKAIHGLLQEMRAAPDAWRGRKVLFVHTGGLLGMYDKQAELQPLVEELGRSHRLQL